MTRAIEADPRMRREAIRNFLARARFHTVGCSNVCSTCGAKATDPLGPESDGGTTLKGFDEMCTGLRANGTRKSGVPCLLSS